MTSRQPTPTSLAVSRSVAWGRRRHRCLGAGFSSHPRARGRPGTSSTPTADRCSVSRCLPAGEEVPERSFRGRRRDDRRAGGCLRRPDRAHRIAPRRALSARNPERRVAVITGGGSGHEPAFFGFVGPGYADGAAVGNVFASPSATPIIELAERADRGDGVFVYGNYEGDVMNFEMASEVLEGRGIRTLHIRVCDDLASDSEARRELRRGLAGDVLVLKVAGARADQGATLDDVYLSAEKANDRTRTVSVALSACTVPASGTPTFRVAGRNDGCGDGGPW